MALEFFDGSPERAVYVDIDETICHYDGVERVYENALPIYDNISKINSLVEDGNFICYWSARGTKTKKNYLNLTMEQLDSWGCRYHKLSVGVKPAYDLLICDKTKRIEEI